MRPSRVILVVDMLNGFCRDGSLASARLDSITVPLRAHLEREAAMGAHIIFLVDTHAPGVSLWSIVAIARSCALS